MEKTCPFCGRFVNDLQAHVRGAYCREITLPTQPIIRENIKSPFEFNAILINKAWNRRRKWGLKIRGQKEKKKVQYFPCGSCDKIFNAARYLTNHRKTHSKKDFCFPTVKIPSHRKHSCFLRHITRTHQSLIMKRRKIRRFTDNELADYQFKSIERSEHGAQRKQEKQQGTSQEPRYPKRSPTKDKNSKEDFEISNHREIALEFEATPSVKKQKEKKDLNSKGSLAKDPPRSLIEIGFSNDPTLRGMFNKMKIRSQKETNTSICSSVEVETEVHVDKNYPFTRATKIFTSNKGKENPTSGNRTQKNFSRNCSPNNNQVESDRDTKIPGNSTVDLREDLDISGRDLIG